jgi:hypothetical protein
VAFPSSGLRAPLFHENIKVSWPIINEIRMLHFIINEIRMH